MWVKKEEYERIKNTMEKQAEELIKIREVEKEKEDKNKEKKWENIPYPPTSYQCSECKKTSYKPMKEFKLKADYGELWWYEKIFICNNCLKK